MLEITSNDIRANSSRGILAALSRKGREYTRSLIRLQDFVPPKRLREMQRIIMHANPHLDEYFAAYLFRACLPDEFSDVPVQEEVLYSHDNDIRAKQLWPGSVLIGFGGTCNGGANKPPVYVYDEHVNTGTRRRDSSCARIVLTKILQGGLDSLKTPLQLLYGEVDHIDANGGAHAQHLGIVNKALQDIRFWFTRTPSAGLMAGFLDDRWKRIIMEAVFTAMAYAIENRVKLSDEEETRKATGESLDHYAARCLWREDPLFAAVFPNLRSTILNVHETFQRAVLTFQTDRNTREPRLDRSGHPIPQRMVLPRIALACSVCWGPVLGQVIMSHLWEAEVVSQLWFSRMAAGLQAIDGEEGSSTQASLGSFTRKQLDQCVETVALPRRRGDPVRHAKKAVWVLSLVASSDVVGPNKAMTSYVNEHNAGLGLCLIENGRYGNRAIFKCQSFPYARWARLIERLMALEGDADDERSPGAWHRTPSSQGLAAPFLVNGNRSHQYVPPSSLDVDALAHLVVQDYLEHPTD